MSPKTKTQFEEIRKSSKDKLIKAAFKLFTEKGYNNTSIRMIAKEAGVSIGLLYNYFTSKEEMLLDILQEAFTNLDSIFVEHEDPGLQLSKSIDAFVKMIVKHKKRFLMLTQFGLDQNKFELANQLTIKKYEQSVHNMAKNLALLHNATNVEMEARILVATLDGLAFEYLLMGNSIPLNQMKEYLIEKYCNL